MVLVMLPLITVQRRYIPNCDAGSTIAGRLEPFNARSERISSPFGKIYYLCYRELRFVRCRYIRNTAANVYSYATNTFLSFDQ